jgi:hypothetical protein
MQVGQSRASLKSDQQQPNPIFLALQNELYASFVDNTDYWKDNASFYTCHRLSLYSSAERSAMLARCPGDIVAAAEGSFGTALIDSTEIDFIDFVLNFKGTRVLALVGTVGVGKTTFLRYVLGRVREHCPSLQRFVPVILNCLAIGNSSPSYTDLMYEAARALQSQRELIPNFERLSRSTLWKNAKFSTARSAVSTTAQSAASQIVALIQKASDLCSPAKEPVIIFDNVDQLTPEAVSRICALATSLHLNTRLAIVTAMRPATFLTQSEQVHGAGAIYHFRISIAPPDLRAVIAPRLTHALKSHGPLTVKLPNGSRLDIKNADAN